MQNPTWTAPTNQTGAAQNCTMQVTADDLQGFTVTRSFTEVVNTVADIVTITSGPTGTPDPVASAGVVTLSVSAVDTMGHALTYAWSATCPGGLGSGQFSSASAQNPTWTAPTNGTGAQQTCSLSVAASDAFGHSATQAWPQRVNSVPDVVTITAGPTGTPNPVASGGPVSLTVTASDSITAHTVSYAWSAVCNGGLGNGSFTSASAQNPTWTAPSNPTATQQTCTLTIVASDGFGHSATGSWTQRVDPAPHTLTITQQPSGNPNPVASGGAVNMSVVATDSLNHTLSYAWSATCAAALGGNGSFANGTTATPTWTAPGQSHRLGADLLDPGDRQ